METIRNYLETMFMKLPDSPEIYKAKNELWQMMEDKYTELLGEGKSENEAVGIVIAEFGNLDELAEDLGIAQFMKSAPQTPQGKLLPLETVKQYLSDAVKHAYLVSLGILCCIISVSGPIFFDTMGNALHKNIGFFQTMGVCMMFVLVAIGVGLIVYSNVRMGKWKNIRQEHYVTDYATTAYIHQAQEQYKGTHAVLLTVGIILCILCVVPVILLSELSTTGYWSNASAGFLFIVVAVGVFLIVMSNMRLGSYNTLLRLNERDTVGGNYVPNQQNAPRYINENVATVMSVFWPTVTCLYLIWSFLTFDWALTWIIWPIAGVIHSVMKNNLTK